MDKVIKINSKEGGPFTTTSNLINFDIMPDGVYDFTDSYVNLVCSITGVTDATPATGQGVYNPLINYTDKITANVDACKIRSLYNVAMVKNCSMTSELQVVGRHPAGRHFTAELERVYAHHRREAEFRVPIFAAAHPAKLPPQQHLPRTSQRGHRTVSQRSVPHPHPDVAVVRTREVDRVPRAEDGENPNPPRDELGQVRYLRQQGCSG